MDGAKIDHPPTLLTLADHVRMGTDVLISRFTAASSSMGVRIVRAQRVRITIAIVHLTSIDADGMGASTVEYITGFADAFDGMRDAFV